MDSYQYAKRVDGALLLSKKDDKTPELTFQSTACKPTWLRYGKCAHCEKSTDVTVYKPTDDLMDAVLSCGKCREVHYCSCKHCGALALKGDDEYQTIEVCKKSGKTYSIETEEHCKKCLNDRVRDMKLHKCGHYSLENSKLCGHCMLQENLRIAAECPEKLQLYAGELSDGERGCVCDDCKQQRLDDAAKEAVDGVFQSENGTIYRIK